MHSNTFAKYLYLYLNTFMKNVFVFVICICDFKKYLYSSTFGLLEIKDFKTNRYLFVAGIKENFKNNFFQLM